MRAGEKRLEWTMPGENANAGPPRRDLFRPGVSLPQRLDADTKTAIIRITGGNFRRLTVSLPGWKEFSKLTPSNR